MPAQLPYLTLQALYCNTRLVTAGSGFFEKLLQAVSFQNPLPVGMYSADQVAALSI